MNRSEIKAAFINACRNNPAIDSQLRWYLTSTKGALDHPKVKLFLSNLENQFKSVQHLRARKGRKLVSKDAMIKMVEDFANVFCTQMKNAHDRMNETAIQKSEREKKEQEIKEFEQTLRGHATGAFEEAGVHVDTQTRIESGATEEEIEESDARRIEDTGVKRL